MADGEVQARVTQLPKVGGLKLVVTTSTGDYIGTLDCDMVNPAALPVLADALRSYAAQHAPQVQIAPASELSRFKTGG